MDDLRFSVVGEPASAEAQGYAEQVNSRGYRVTELRTILFPTVIGEQVIEPAMLTIPSSLFQRGMSLQTEPISVNVKPLPEPIPADFSGAVGQYSLSAMAQTEAGESGNLLSVQVDEPVTLRVTLEGAGNLENSGDDHNRSFNSGIFNNLP